MVFALSIAYFAHLRQRTLHRESINSLMICKMFVRTVQPIKSAMLTSFVLARKDEWPFTAH